MCNFNAICCDGNRLRQCIPSSTAAVVAPHNSTTAPSIKKNRSYTIIAASSRSLRLNGTSLSSSANSGVNSTKLPLVKQASPRTQRISISPQRSSDKNNMQNCWNCRCNCQLPQITAQQMAAMKKLEMSSPQTEIISNDKPKLFFNYLRTPKARKQGQLEPRCQDTKTLSVELPPKTKPKRKIKRSVVENKSSPEQEECKDLWFECNVPMRVSIPTSFCLGAPWDLLESQPPTNSQLKALPAPVANTNTLPINPPIATSADRTRQLCITIRPMGFTPSVRPPSAPLSANVTTEKCEAPTLEEAKEPPTPPPKPCQSSTLVLPTSNPSPVLPADNSSPKLIKKRSRSKKKLNAIRNRELAVESFKDSSTSKASEYFLPTCKNQKLSPDFTRQVDVKNRRGENSTTQKMCKNNYSNCQKGIQCPELREIEGQNRESELSVVEDRNNKADLKRSGYETNSSLCQKHKLLKDDSPKYSAPSVKKSESLKISKTNFEIRHKCKVPEDNNRKGSELSLNDGNLRISQCGEQSKTASRKDSKQSLNDKLSRDDSFLRESLRRSELSLDETKVEDRRSESQSISKTNLKTNSKCKQVSEDNSQKVSELSFYDKTSIICKCRKPSKIPSPKSSILSLNNETKAENSIQREFEIISRKPKNTEEYIPRCSETSFDETNAETHLECCNYCKLCENYTRKGSELTLTKKENRDLNSSKSAKLCEVFTRTSSELSSNRDNSFQLESEIRNEERGTQSQRVCKKNLGWCNNRKVSKDKTQREVERNSRTSKSRKQSEISTLTGSILSMSNEKNRDDTFQRESKTNLRTCSNQNPGEEYSPRCSGLSLQENGDKDQNSKSQGIPNLEMCKNGKQEKVCIRKDAERRCETNSRMSKNRKPWKKPIGNKSRTTSQLGINISKSKDKDINNRHFVSHIVAGINSRINNNQKHTKDFTRTNSNEIDDDDRNSTNSRSYRISESSLKLSKNRTRESKNYSLSKPTTKLQDRENRANGGNISETESKNYSLSKPTTKLQIRSNEVDRKNSNKSKYANKLNKESEESLRPSEKNSATESSLYKKMFLFLSTFSPSSWALSETSQSLRNMSAKEPMKLRSERSELSRRSKNQHSESSLTSILSERSEKISADENNVYKPSSGYEESRKSLKSKQVSSQQSSTYRTLNSQDTRSPRKRVSRNKLRTSGGHSKTDFKCNRLVSQFLNSFSELWAESARETEDRGQHRRRLSSTTQLAEESQSDQNQAELHRNLIELIKQQNKLFEINHRKSRSKNNVPLLTADESNLQQDHQLSDLDGRELTGIQQVVHDHQGRTTSDKINSKTKSLNRYYQSETSQESKLSSKNKLRICLLRQESRDAPPKLEEYNVAGFTRSLSSHPLQKGGEESSRLPAHKWENLSAIDEKNVEAVLKDLQRFCKKNSANLNDDSRKPVVLVPFRPDGQHHGEMLGMCKPDEWRELKLPKCCEMQNRIKKQPQSSNMFLKPNRLTGRFKRTPSYESKLTHSKKCQHCKQEAELNARKHCLLYRTDSPLPQPQRPKSLRKSTDHPVARSSQRNDREHLQSSSAKAAENPLTTASLSPAREKQVRLSEHQPQRNEYLSEPRISSLLPWEMRSSDSLSIKSQSDQTITSISRSSLSDTSTIYSKQSWSSSKKSSSKSAKSKSPSRDRRRSENHRKSRSQRIDKASFKREPFSQKLGTPMYSRASRQQPKERLYLERNRSSRDRQQAKLHPTEPKSKQQIRSNRTDADKNHANSRIDKNQSQSMRSEQTEKSIRFNPEQEVHDDHSKACISQRGEQQMQKCDDQVEQSYQSSTYSHQSRNVMEPPCSSYSRSLYGVQSEQESYATTDDVKIILKPRPLRSMSAEDLKPLRQAAAASVEQDSLQYCECMDKYRELKRQHELELQAVFRQANEAYDRSFERQQQLGEEPKSISSSAKQQQQQPEQQWHATQQQQQQRYVEQEEMRQLLRHEQQRHSHQQQQQQQQQLNQFQVKTQCDCRCMQKQIKQHQQQQQPQQFQAKKCDCQCRQEQHQQQQHHQQLQHQHLDDNQASASLQQQQQQYMQHQQYIQQQQLQQQQHLQLQQYLKQQQQPPLQLQPDTSYSTCNNYIIASPQNSMESGSYCYCPVVPPLNMEGVSSSFYQQTLAKYGIPNMPSDYTPQQPHICCAQCPCQCQQKQQQQQ